MIFSGSYSSALADVKPHIFPDSTGYYIISSIVYSSEFHPGICKRQFAVASVTCDVFPSLSQQVGQILINSNELFFLSLDYGSPYSL